MTPQQRSLTMLGVILAAMVVFGAWYLLLRPTPPPVGYEFPRHGIWGGGPGALYEGVLTDDDGCIRAGEFLVIWPSAYSLTLEDTGPVVHGDGRDAPVGAALRLGGGYYEDGLPDAAADAQVGTCGGPYFLTSGFAD